MDLLVHLIKKEMLEHLLSLRFAITCLLCLVVSVTNTVVRTMDYRKDLRAYRAKMETRRSEILEAGRVLNKRIGQPYIHELWGSSKGIFVYKPLRPLRVFVQGIDPGRMETVSINDSGAHFSQVRQWEGNPIPALFHPVDLLFFVGSVMSLLALCFSYDAISGEKESGTLKLMMSYSIPRDMVLLSKWLSGYLILIQPFLISVCISLIVVLAFPEVHLSGGPLVALAALIVLSLLYILVMYSLGLFISTRTTMSSTSLIVLYLIWIVYVLVIPNLSPYVGRQLFPVPSLESVKEQKLSIAAEAFTRQGRLFGDPRYGHEIIINSQSMGFSLNEEGQRKFDEIGQQAEQEIQEVGDRFIKALNQQILVSKRVSRLSPLSSLVYAACDISDTGQNEHKGFRKAVERYRERWIEYLSKDFQHREGLARHQLQIRGGSPYTDPWEVDISDYPRLGYNGTPFADRFEHIAPDLVLLAVWNVVFFMAAYLSFLRYDVT